MNRILAVVCCLVQALLALPAGGREGTPLRAELLGTTVMDVPPGQYSGISYISGKRYAVVHDNAGGGGIWYFSIPLPQGGSFGTILAEPAIATPGSREQRDSEGIAYVPSTGSFFVSGEARQDILEYGFDGRPTGRSLAVPERFGTDRIRGNRGFEALTFSPQTGLFRTTTEMPLIADETAADGPQLLRLQSFALSDLEPREERLYLTEAPEERPDGARSYVFGVPALAALPDGRLLVMEREVYVPSGSLLEQFRLAHTRTRIFVVDPRTESTEALEKELVIDFQTRALDLADYEGMCLGPVLEDGTQTLLLIADSQGGMSGLLQEWVRVYALR